MIEERNQADLGKRGVDQSRSWTVWDIRILSNIDINNINILSMIYCNGPSFICVRLSRKLFQKLLIEKIFTFFGGPAIL